MQYIKQTIDHARTSPSLTSDKEVVYHAQSILMNYRQTIQVVARFLKERTATIDKAEMRTPKPKDDGSVGKPYLNLLNCPYRQVTAKQSRKQTV